MNLLDDLKRLDGLGIAILLSVISPIALFILIHILTYKKEILYEYEVRQSLQTYKGVSCSDVNYDLIDNSWETETWNETVSEIYYAEFSNLELIDTNVDRKFIVNNENGIYSFSNFDIPVTIKPSKACGKEVKTKTESNFTLILEKALPLYQKVYLKIVRAARLGKPIVVKRSWLIFWGIDLYEPNK